VSVDQTDPIAVRNALLQAGHFPIPCIGKRPVPKAWTNIRASYEDIARWSIEYAFAANTGILAFRTPAIDVDVCEPSVADNIEEFVRKQFSCTDCFLKRIGRPPKRLFPFRTISPFGKIKSSIFFSTPDMGHHVEVLADGQQYVVCGDHPETGASYFWSDPIWCNQWRDLPVLDEDRARKIPCRCRTDIPERGVEGATTRTAPVIVKNDTDTWPP
jgi:Bifunctional DNA primase/polymerase, N-terminal